MKAPGKHLNLRLLEVFTTVVRYQGYARAQHELNLTVSAISNYMNELETRLGYVLCQRGRSGFALTPKGEQFLQHSLRLLSEIAQFERESGALKGDMGGNFRLGVLDATANDPDLALPELIGRFNEQFPAVHLNLLIRSPHDLLMGIQDNRLDLAVGAFPFRVSNVIELALYHEQHWLYCSDQHPLFGQSKLDLLQVTQHGFVTRSYWSPTDLGAKGFKHSTATVDNMEAQLMLILSGKYVGYLPEHYAHPWLDAGRLRVIMPNEFGYQAPFSAIFRRGRSQEPFIRAMRDMLKMKTLSRKRQRDTQR